MEHIQQGNLDTDQFVSLNEPHMQQHHETLQQMQHQQHMHHQHHQLQMYQQQHQQQQQHQPHDTHQLQLHHQQQSSHHQQQSQQPQQPQTQSQAPHITNAPTINQQQQQHRINRPMNPRSSLGRNINNLPFRPHQNPHAIHAAMTPSAQTYLRQVPAAPSSDFPLRMLVQSDMVGAIIGRAGGTIRQITQQSKARIDVHREDNSDQQEKIITIGGAPEACSVACQKILEVMLQEAMSGNSQHGTEIHLKILAYNNLIGRLIGKSGASIKKIMEQTNTKINVSASNFSDWSNERVITIEGNPEDINHAEQVISSKLRAAYASDLSMTMQALNQQQHFMFPGLNPMSLVTAPYSQHPMLSTIANSQPGGHSVHGTSRVAGPHQGSTHLAGGHIYAGPTSYLPPIYPNIGGASAHGGPNGPFLGFPSGMTGMENEKETVYLYIPNSTVGAIIGKFGTTIKEMINNSGASIKVAAAEASSTSPIKNESTIQSSENESQDQSGQSRPVYNSNSNSNNMNNINDRTASTRRVSIVGSPESQWTAQYLIYRKVSLESSTNDLSLMVEIHVPSNMVGKIIGKAGTTVKNIQKQTRTTIRLPEERNANTGEDSETPVYITGEFQNSQVAQRQIRNLIKDNNLYQYRSKQHQISRQQHDNKEGNQTNEDNNRYNQERPDQDPTRNASNSSDQVDSAENNEDEKNSNLTAETSCTLAPTNSDDGMNKNSDKKSDLDQRPSVTNSNSTPSQASSPGPQLNNINTQSTNKDNERKKELDAEIKNGLTPQKVVQDNSGEDINKAPVNNCKS